MTGTRGFLGFHTRAAALETADTTHRIAVGRSFDPGEAAATLDSCDTLIHIAGINRGSDSEVTDGNITFAEQIASAVRASEKPPRRIVYANSIQAHHDNVYGSAKSRAGEILGAAAAEAGSTFSSELLPNLFGEFGRPNYNSVTATFCDQIAAGRSPSIHQNAEISLLHVQNAADLLLGRITAEQMNDLVAPVRVKALADRITEFAQTYRDGTIPALRSVFDRDLFNTYRSFTFPEHTPIRLTRHADARGSFFEVIRNCAGEDQTSFSTTVPGVTRGDHFHRRKIERFAVLSGTATISLRRLFDDRVHRFEVTGDEPVAIDMPTMVTHNITNTGSDALYTMFWANEIFDPESPDTIPHEV